MSETEKRPPFRFHLLTAVLMMLAAGGMLWANVRQRLGDQVIGEWWCYGWPFKAAERHLGVNFNISDFDPLPPANPFDPEPYALKYFGTNIALNCVIALAILAAVALISEFLLRRREGRKP